MLHYHQTEFLTNERQQIFLAEAIEQRLAASVNADQPNERHLPARWLSQWLSAWGRLLPGRLPHTRCSVTLTTQP